MESIRVFVFRLGIFFGGGKMVAQDLENRLEAPSSVHLLHGSMLNFGRL